MLGDEKEHEKMYVAKKRLLRMMLEVIRKDGPRNEWIRENLRVEYRGDKLAESMVVGTCDEERRGKCVKEG